MWEGASESNYLLLTHDENSSGLKQNIFRLLCKLQSYLERNWYGREEVCWKPLLDGK